MRVLLAFILFVSTYSYANSGHSFIGTQVHSGDIVGNGRLIQEYHDGPTLEDAILTPEERDMRNQELDNYFNGIDFNIQEIRSGDIVGNGGGFYEMLASSFYQAIPKHIVAALNQDAVPFTSLERLVLYQILKNHTSSGQNGKLIFVNEKDLPGFFFVEGVDKMPRIAKTGFSRDYPIFINLDQVYLYAQSTPGFWITMFIHELGHQAGIKSHSFLDTLGAKVSAVMSMGRHEIAFGQSATNVLKVQLINHFYTEAMPDLYITRNDELAGIFEWPTDSFDLQCGSLTYDGFQLSNLHWMNRGVTERRGETVLTLGAWAQVRCLQKETMTYITSHRDVEIDITIKYNKLDTEVRLQPLLIENRL